MAPAARAAMARNGTGSLFRVGRGVVTDAVGSGDGTVVISGLGVATVVTTVGVTTRVEMWFSGFSVYVPAWILTPL